ncbi:uncharacterized protein PHACADRAFT_203640 [Phanerochaete carnosa HHB-10118-sp]|uniref:Uncharacterized protein n=1 Tax=Phanerochaete carnosa (strain HHB-10118-sp) TaxID=650164 RepID=K5XBT9_PHACS|nr:uncharacterized protein PHACADRAFT_203640 [Phanerochaete carnosa HHB-10118-sp]EKM60437.1 hypothetical protein PHACADRAFT_203640 [Phanerochaete carnosa HHB-10118-sp]
MPPFREFLVDERRCVDALYHVDKSEGHAHLACACLAAMSFENYCHNLQERDPRSRLACVNFNIMAGKWWVHVRHAKYTAELEEHLYRFVQDIRLALHAWIYTEFGPDQINCTTQDIWNYLQPSEARRVICSEFLKFGIYVKLWQFGVARSPNHTQPQVTSGDISRAIQKVPPQVQELLPGLDLTVNDSHLARYQAIMEDLMTQINQDARTREVWRIGWSTEVVYLASQDTLYDVEPTAMPLRVPTITAASSSPTTTVALSETFSTPPPENGTGPSSDEMRCPMRPMMSCRPLMPSTMDLPATLQLPIWRCLVFIPAQRLRPQTEHGPPYSPHLSQAKPMKVPLYPA